MNSIEIEPTRSGVNTLKIDKFYVHSKFEPIREAEKIINKEYTKNYVHIVYGYGLGYLITELLKISKDEKIIVIDPLLEKGQIKLSNEHLKNDRVIVWTKNSLNTLSYVVHQCADGLDQNIKVICTTNYNKIFEEDYAETLRIIRDVQSKAQIGRSTSLYFAETWQRNTIKNLPYILKDYSVMQLRNKFDLPIVVASGGPSLTKQLKYLKEIEGSVIIIAAGSTINSLLAANIEPDFVVTIDGGEPNYRHFKEIQVNKTKIIYGIINHFGIRPLFPDKGYTFMGFNEAGLQNYFQKTFDVTIPRISGSATVAHFAFSVAQIMNSGPIAFIGQDLAYTNNQTHAKANKHFEEVKDLTDLAIDLVEVDGYYDEKVQTSKVFLSMLTSFEEMVRFHQLDQPVFNCTEGGAKIKGMDQLAFNEFIDKFVDSSVRKNMTLLDDSEPNKISNEVIIDKLNEEKLLLKKLKNKCDEAVLALKRNKLKTGFEQKTLDTLAKIDNYIEKNTVKTQVHYLIDPITIEVKLLYLEKENESSEETYSRAYKQSYALYSKLNKAYAQTITIIDEVINDLEGVL